MKKKVLALILTLAMLASLATLPAAAAGSMTYPDAVGHWAEESIMRWSRCGLVKGDNLGNVNPNQPLRRCEMATILSDMLGLRTAAPISTFRDIDGSEWYSRAILRCAAAGIMEGSNSMCYPEDYITREETIVMFARALGVPANDDPDLSDFTDGDEVSGWAAPYMDTLVELGILSGMGDGTLAPHADINRAGAFTLMDKAISVYANAPGTYNSKNANGFVVVNANDRQDSDVIVTGSATGVLVAVGATDPVKFRNLKADNVVVNGKSDVTVTGSSELGALEVNQKLNLTLEADTKVGELTVKAEEAAVTNAGTVEKMMCAEVSTVTNSGKVGELVGNAAADITNTGTVDKLVANAAITVDNNKGTVKNAEINMGGVVMDGPPQTMTVADGVARPSNSSGRPITASGAVSSGGSSGGGGGYRPSVSVTGVTLDATGWVMNVGDTKTLKATVEPSNASNKSVTWTSSNETVATVAGGTVTAVAEGTATITVTTSNSGKTAVCEITVRPEGSTDPIPVKSVTFDKEALELEAGADGALKLIIDPANATKDGDAKWESSDNNVVTVDQTGKLTAVAPGTAEITATITVTTPEQPENPGEGGDPVDPADPENPGGTTDPENPGEGGGTTDPDNPGGNTDPTDPADPEGGTAAQADTVETFTAKCTVTVKAKLVNVTGVTLDKATLELEEGKTATLTATVAPADATDKTVTWTSSKENVATVTDGVVTAVAEGTATITVTTTDGGFAATCEVSVTKGTVTPPEEPAVTEVKVTPATASVQVGETVKLTATVTTVGGAADTVTWTSSNDNVATVVDGTVTGVAAGEATITATSTFDPNQSATCAVEVTNSTTPTEPEVKLNKEALTLTLADDPVTETLSVTVDGAPTAESITWDSDNKDVATVAEGVVTAHTAGKANITATLTVNEKEHVLTCVVTVEAKPDVTISVTGISVTPTEINAKVGDTIPDLIAEITPDNATNQEVTWESSDTDVVTVGNNGSITIVGPGTATVTVKSVENQEISASCTITIKEKPAITNVTVKVPEGIQITAGEEIQLELTVEKTPAEIEYTVVWSIEGEGEDPEPVATITADGKVTFAKAGTIMVKVEVTLTVGEGEEAVIRSANIELTLASTEESGGEEIPTE